MTDTENKLAIILECLPASPFKEQVRGVHSEILVEIESLRARVADLEKKLEVDPQSNWDGIDCRDETIKLLEAKVEALKLEAQLDAEGPDWIQRALQAEAKLEVASWGQGEPVYWLAGTGDLYSSVAIAEQFGAAKPYIPLYTQAPTIPEGWQLVPIEPTREMLEAGYFTTSAANRSVWADMLSAAPKP